MKSRFIPYANTPGRLVTQLFSDTVVVIWSFVWVLVGLAVHSAVSTIAEVGRQVQGGADGVADSLKSAGHSADHIPLVGSAVSEPLTAASRPHSISPAPATTWTPPRAGWPSCWRWRLRRHRRSG